jgi:predicted Zn-dependent protease
MLYLEVRALATLGLFEEMDERLDECVLRVGQMTPGAMARVTAVELLAHGHPEAAWHVLDRAIAWYQARPAEEATTPGHRYELAISMYHAGQRDEAKALFEGLAVEFPQSSELKGYLGALAASRGEREEALRISSELQSLERHPLTSLPTPLWQARIAAVLGEKEHAVTLLQDAMTHMEYKYYRLHTYLELQSLQDYPPYQELVRPKG